LSADGPQFILIELDTPGGSIGMAKELCAAINAADCDVVMFITGGKYGGAISAGAAISLSCDKIYMVPSSVLGGATVVASTGRGITDIKKVAGDDVGEKLSSIWRGTMASIAEGHGRSGVMAKAMVDRQISVAEITRDGTRMFVEQQEVQKTDKLLKKWNNNGKLITLTGDEAVKCGMADGLADSRPAVLKAMNVSDAQVLEDKSPQEALDQFNTAKNRSQMLNASLRAKFGTLRATKTRAAGMKLIRDIKTDMGTLIALGKANPDLHLNVQSLQNEYAEVEAFYKQAARD
jgi:membrane-bound ClpP family serine protease